MKSFGLEGILKFIRTRRALIERKNVVKTQSSRDPSSAGISPHDMPDDQTDLECQEQSALFVGSGGFHNERQLTQHLTERTASRTPFRSHAPGLSFKHASAGEE